MGQQKAEVSFVRATKKTGVSFVWPTKKTGARSEWRHDVGAGVVAGPGPLEHQLDGGQDLRFDVRYLLGRQVGQRRSKSLAMSRMHVPEPHATK